MTTIRALAILLSIGAFALAAAADDAPRIAELERQLAELAQRLAELEDGLGVDPSEVQELRRQVQILAREIEDLKLGEAAVTADVAERGLGPAASKVYRLDRGVSVGGYAELLYENFDSRREDGAASGRTDRLDLLRAIVYVGYKFNDRIVFNSEIEFEHASTGRGGEVSVEFAYVDFLLNDAFNVRAGLVLVPMGFVNELHEPPVFLGSRRPFVEQALIPTTWRENGVGVYGEHGPLSFRAYLVNGLAAVAGTSSQASGFSGSGIRDGRSKGSKSAADDLAWVGRLDWAATRGLTLGLSGYTGGAGQGRLTPSGIEIGADTTIWDAHAEYAWRGLSARALYVRSSIDDVALINEAQALVGAESVGERQLGWYGELGYDVFSSRDTEQALIPYLRYESYNTQDRVPVGFAADPANEVEVTTLGVAWKPILNVAVKADYNRIENGARTGVNQINIALGLLF